MNEQQHSEQQHSEQPPKDDKHHYGYGSYIADQISQKELNRINKKDQEDAINRVKEGKIPRGTKIA